MKKQQVWHAGIDIGSTTTKIAVIDDRNQMIYSEYVRHHSHQVKSVYEALLKLASLYPDAAFHIAMTGSGSKLISERLGLPFIQEVVANALALRVLYGNVRTAVELGGQDAKLIFFRKDETRGDLNVSDMRMNGSCAGGTGAFIDEMAQVLKVDVEDFNGCAAKGSTVYPISGRCGVYAKTDIQPLLNQGVAREDLALSTFHAIAKQTIGGLAQGLDILPPVAFEGGPLCFNPVLIRVFAERLNLKEEDIIIPEHAEVMVAYGAALSFRSLFEGHEETVDPAALAAEMEKHLLGEVLFSAGTTRPFFEPEEEKEAFLTRHKRPDRDFSAGSESHIRAFLGIDSGSTTTKFVLMDENEQLLDSFYARNQGDPLMVAKEALISMRDRYRSRGQTLEILAAASTGYGELLFQKAFHTECHLVETVAHARAAEKYIPDATFILDIGGQDMKAIWLDHGIITDIMINEACSSGCGSFLENFADTLNIPVEKIAEAAFSSAEPAALGSRCTVFMNSSIITEQRNGRQPADIMAGLCRSIIENVFTKVIRISNTRSLGDRVVVQGGTFENDAVLCAMEQYLGRRVIRAPYPGIMGAIGAALTARENYLGGQREKTFIGLDALDGFSYTQEANEPCPFCSNHCRRTIVRFSGGDQWVTNNRCERGEILGDPRDSEVRRRLAEVSRKKASVPNLFNLREKLLMQDYPYLEDVPAMGMTIGLPRVLAFWETMPFWRTFLRSCGFEVKVSPESTRKIYENGLYAVTSDTICFPAKLVHGHVRWLMDAGVDRIFMPSITTVSSENTEKTSQSMCAVVKGYPIVMRNSDNPSDRGGVPFDAPLWHWYTEKDRDRQLTAYMKETFGLDEGLVRRAVAAADAAQEAFKNQLKAAGAAIIEDVKAAGKYAVVLASRPYQNDPLVNHELPDMFTAMGIPVLTADSIPGTEEIDLSSSRLDVVNNFHARMLTGAIMAAKESYLEYVQIVSFGCGHDAYLSDEIIRLMKEIAGRTPLVLKLDESDIQGPLRIRVRSFIETVNMRRRSGLNREPEHLRDPYPVKFSKQDIRDKIILVPNTSHAFCRIMSAALAGQGINAVPLEVGRENAIRLGKAYVHNDICFPAQIVIGEIIDALQSGKYDLDHVAVGMAKYIGDCRLTHYSALLRKALDDAGFGHVAILTNDDVDYHDMHPGFKMNLISAVRLAVALPMIDALEELLRKIRPYELESGSTEKAFETGMDALVEGLEKGGVSGAKRGFKKAIELMKSVAYDRSRRRPRVLIVGAYLLNFHPGANHEIEQYLEKNGFEIIEAKMTDVIQKSYFYQDSQVKEYHLEKPFKDKAYLSLVDRVFDMAHDMTDKIAAAHPLYEKAVKLRDLVKDSDQIIHHTFDAGEGVLIPGEIIHHAHKGCRNFVILQPFGCLPNHIVGRGIAKRLKELFPDAQILPLDYDPDVSFANIENRLQMLIMNAASE